MTTHEVNGSGEAWLAERIGPRCRTIVDVGANRGEWTKMLLSHAPQVEHAFLFEPGRRAAEMLRQAFASRPEVNIIEAALSDHVESEALFFEEPEAGNTSSLTRGASTAAAVETRVKVSTLDLEAERLGVTQVDLLKIDAEGSDLAVLRGASNLLHSARVGIVQWEYSDSWAPGGGTLAAALNFLSAAGYRSYLLKHDGLYRFDYDVWGDFFNYSNFVSIAEHGTLPSGEVKELL
jgi:FkbM family methyltransferase